MTAAIEARDVFLIYALRHGDVAALRGLTVSVAPKEIVAVLGPSGAGKSSLLSLCAGFRRPSSGRLTVLGTDVSAAQGSDVADLRRRAIGIVRQHYHRSLPAELSVVDIVALPARIAGAGTRAARLEAARLLEASGMRSRAHAKPFELSGGEQQRVALCAAVAKRPRLLLADEPTGELDPRTSSVVVDLLLGLTRAADAAAIIVTHDPEVALRADRTIHLRDGRLSAEGATTPVLVVDEQGWVRLPRRIRERAGVGERVTASAEEGRIHLAAMPSSGESAPKVSKRPRPAPEVKRHAAEAALDNVSKRHDDQVVLAGLSWTFEPELLHVVAGPSGSGKTSVLNLIAALERPDSGQVWAAGERIDSLTRHTAALWRQKVLGYVSQHSTLADFLSARENVELGPALRGFDPSESSRLADHWLEWMGLAGLADRPADRLSGGEQRRIALARALAGQPRILVADEPTAHLDRLSGRLVIQLLRDVVRETGVTVIAASHDPDLVAAADRRLDLAAQGEPV
jgi:ABC-type lipoprotein export system ATPase subunit